MQISFPCILLQLLDAARGRAVHHVVLLENTTTAARRAGAGGRQVVGVRDVVVVLGELLEGLALGLLDEQRGEDAAEHEEGVDLEDVVEPGGGVGRGGAAGAEGGDGALACFVVFLLVITFFLLFFFGC